MSARLLVDVSTFLRRFVVLGDDEASAIALWVAHTHAFEAADVTPYLALTSPLKRSGKTRTLELLKLLVPVPLPTANISDAALFRAIENLHPTLLFDEVDAIFGPKARDREDLRGMLNAGYERDAVVHRMGGPNNRTLETFNVFAPKVFAGIGELPDTIADRAIRIRLQRRRRDEQVERFRRREVEPEAHELRDRLADWLQPQIDYLRSLRPALPDDLDDRAQDIWEPLLAIADLAGEEWPARARADAVALSTGIDARGDDSISAQVLADIHQVLYYTVAVERIKTGDLIAALCTIDESPWGEWFGKPLTAHSLSKLLKPFGIRTMPVKVDGVTVRGYKREQFEDAFSRVLSVTGVTGVTSGSESQIEVTESNAVTLHGNPGVTSEPASEAGCNAGNACNALLREGERIPRAGDVGTFTVFSRCRCQEGHLTRAEHLANLHLHRRIVEAAEPPLDDELERVVRGEFSGGSTA